MNRKLHLLLPTLLAFGCGGDNGTTATQASDHIRHVPGLL